MPDLKPCPFCGSDKITISDSGSGMYASCRSCDAIGTHIPYEKDKWDATCKAIEAWNTRYQPTCQWKYKTLNNIYDTSCGKTLFLDSGTNYCSNCGKPVEVVD